MNTKWMATLLPAALVLLFSLATQPAKASVDQHDLLMLKTAKDIEYISQKITKAYFYKQLDIRADQAERDLRESLSLLDQGIPKLHSGTSDTEGKNIATFLSYTSEELLETLKKPYSKENGALMIDYSESLMEGANVISQRHIKGRGPEEAMMVETEQLLFLLERINKYYIAHKAGFKDYNNVIQLEQAVRDFERGLAKVNSYKGYSQEERQSVENINQFWPIAKEFYLGVQQGALPVIVLASTDRLEREVKTLGTYHQTAVGTKK
jgi:hypothetical protein